MTTLTEQADTYAENHRDYEAIELHLRRAFMAGAITALTSKQPREALLAECLQFGRAIGTAAERAQA